VSAPHDPFPKLPHAAPFLLLDRVLEMGERSAVFVKLVAAADPLVAPDGTLPPAFVLEALAQGGGALLNTLGREGWTAGYLAGVDDFRSLRPVRVGDTLRVEVEIQRHVGGATMLRGRGLVDGELVAEGRFTLAVPR
jgi:3-hydroxymyristoyl/3-hydroxydecanoyl-(acyl carrier protein) dehydratase